MENFTPVASLLGGMLIGIAALVLLAFNGHIAGVTGVARGVLTPKQNDTLWRVVFLLGLVVGPFVFQAVSGETIVSTITSSTLTLVIGGLLVGFGTSMGNGCTSGHGICGLGRVSKRSLAATGAFMATAIVTVYMMRHVLGGAS
ncbi:MAG: YeeE/YedE family protein [Proteobacteria bacterium]|nr:YeeE/YedE family protein [Pseudomonadota bacterium]